MGAHLLGPTIAVSNKPFGVEVNAGSIFRAERIGLGAFQRKAALPEGPLGRAEFFVACVLFAVVRGLGGEPGNFSTGLCAAMVGRLVICSPSGSHCRTLVAPAPVEATPIGRW